MTPAEAMLRQGWEVTKGFHGQDAEYISPTGVRVPLKALVRHPPEEFGFTRRQKGNSFLVDVDSGTDYARDGRVFIGGVTYRIIDVDRQPAAIAVTLTLSAELIGGRQ